MKKYNDLKEILASVGYVNSFTYHMLDDSLILTSPIYLNNNIKSDDIEFSLKETFKNLKITKGTKFYIDCVAFNDFGFLPKTSEHINISSCNFHKHKIHECVFYLDVCADFEFLDSTLEKITFGKAIFSHISLKMLKGLNHIILDKDLIITDSLILTCFPDLKSLDNKTFILPKKLNSLHISQMNAITHFSENMDIVADYLSLDNFYCLESWRNIDKMKIKKTIRLSRMNTKKNIVNLMLLETKNVFCDNIYFAPYNIMSNRKEFIMDFVLMLLDNDLSEEAEL